MNDPTIDPTPAPEPVVPPEAPEAVSPAWTGPSKEEWEGLITANKKLSSDLEALTTTFAEPQPSGDGEFDLSQLDMTDPYQAAWFVDQIAKNNLQQVTPYVKNAAQDQGRRQLEEMLGKHESDLKKDFPAGFDHKLAERAAFAFFDESGDAPASVEAAARYAAEVRANERKSAVEEYRGKNKRGAAMSDLGVKESGVAAAPTMKTFDEVLDHWAQQTEA